MSNNFYLILIAFFISNNSYCQCDSNLIKNGSFELDSIGESIIGQHWIALDGSPDLDNANDDFPQITGQKWDGQVLSSNDGGNWQNISYRDFGFGLEQFENIGQEIIFQKCVPHILEFEFAAQIIESIFNRNGHSAVNVYLDNTLIYTTKLDTTVFTWEKVEIQFTPSQKESTLEFQVNSNLNYEGPQVLKYVAIDGVCLRPVKMGMFCEYE